MSYFSLAPSADVKKITYYERVIEFSRTGSKTIKKNQAFCGIGSSTGGAGGI